MWEESRGSARAASAATREHAHSDDAKSRAHEGSRLPIRSLRPRVLAGVGVGLAVLAILLFLGLRGGDDATQAALTGARPSPSEAADSPPSPAEALSQSQPSGVWKLVVKGRTQMTRGGRTTPLKQRDDPVEWTFPAAECSDSRCSGTISSSSGKEFAFTWNGSELDVTLGQKTQRNKKAACVDTETGQVQPIEEAAARLTYHFSWGPFVGTPDKMTAVSTTRTTYEWFGTCEEHDTDLVKATYQWVLTPAENG